MRFSCYNIKIYSAYHGTPQKQQVKREVATTSYHTDFLLCLREELQHTNAQLGSICQIFTLKRQLLSHSSVLASSMARVAAALDFSPKTRPDTNQS